jgi:serine/threonine protein kinase
MNNPRCDRCGETLGVDAAGAPLPCPRCGPAPDGSATVVVRPGELPTLQPGVSAKDTDANAAALMRTVAFGGAPQVTKAPGTGGYGPELYDFLAPPQEADELGRLGAYRVLRVLGAGGMGVVYEAEDPALQRRVALKAMLPTLAVSASARQRFVREARAAAAVEHECIVPIFQVGEERGIPFLVMPLLKGETLEDRLGRERRLSLPETIRIGREIAEALAAAHGRGLVHRDIKPGNVWLEAGRGNVKLLDFGLARATESDTPLTQQGSIVGTPAFMAPEQASGGHVDARSDLFSLGCVLYRMCTGVLPFQGSSAVSILVAIVGQQPTLPQQINADLPPALTELIMTLLAKDPAARLPSAEAVIDRLQGIPVPGPATPSAKTENITLRIAPLPTAPAIPPTGQPPRSRRWPLLVGGGALVVLLGAAALFIPALLNRPDAPVEIGIAYGTEKQGWFKDAVADFAATPEGKNIKINLIPMGSVEGGQAVSRHEDQRIHVWSPASSLYKATFVRDWEAKHPGHRPILKEEALCMTPLAFVFWKDRHDAFLAKYKTVSFTTLADAMHAKGGWGDIAGKPEWGRFRFGQTNPGQSNSGLMALVLMACELNEDRPVTAADLADPALKARLAAVKSGLAGTSNSTGNLMKDMVTKGPNSFDALVIYESLAIDYLKAAQGRWGDLHVAYPRRNLWSENPYYILDVPWSSKEQRQAAETFLAFLMSEPMQRKALAHGFRPANINIPIRDDPESPFVRHKDRGLNVNIAATCEFPRDTAVDELLNLWERGK